MFNVFRKLSFPIFFSKKKFLKLVFFDPEFSLHSFQMFDIFHQLFPYFSTIAQLHVILFASAGFCWQLLVIFFFKYQERVGHFFVFVGCFLVIFTKKNQLGFLLFEKDLEGNEFSIKKTEVKNER